MRARAGGGVVPRALAGAAFAVLAACAGDGARGGASADSAAAATPADPVAAAELRIFLADSLRQARPEGMKVYAGVAGGLVAVMDTTKWPESEVSYNVWLDDAGRPLGHAEVPYSESGDWSAVFVHYFDPQGNTLALVQHTGWLDAGCANALNRTVRALYAPGLRPVRVDTAWSDGDGRPVDPHDPKCIVRNDLSTAPVVHYDTLVAEKKAPPMSW